MNRRQPAKQQLPLVKSQTPQARIVQAKDGVMAATHKARGRRKK